MYLQHPTNKQDAVSPVIAIILLIALTVILAGIIGAAVMGFIPGIESGKNVGLTLNPYTSSTESGVEITIYGGTDAASLISIRIECSGAAFQNPIISQPQIGVAYRFPITEETTSGIAQINIIGNFADGTEEVLLQSYIQLNDGSNVVVTDNGYLLVTFDTYSNTTPVSEYAGVIPGRGMSVKIVELLKGTTKVNEMKITTSNSKFKFNMGNPIYNPELMTEYHAHINASYSTATADNDRNPYEEQSLNPEVTLDVTATFKVQTEKTITDTVNRASVTIPARQVIFNMPDIAAGTIKKLNNNKIPVSLDTLSLKVSKSNGILTGTNFCLQLWLTPSDDTNNHILLATQNSIWNKGNYDLSLKGDVNLNTYPKDSNVDLYLMVSKGKNNWASWYYLDTKTVGDILDV